MWIAYDKAFHLGQYHTDRLLAQLIALTFNAWKDKETPPLNENMVLGKFEPLSEQYVTSTIRSAKHGVN